jgi:putative DNA primase/helicase
MRTGRAIVSLDNLNGELGSDLLCQVVTQPVVSYRPLGSSTEERITSRSVYTANGNNITIVDDLSRRTLLATIDAGWKSPVNAYTPKTRLR